MKLLFWVSVLLLIYPYVIYPLLLRYLVRRERLAETTAMAEMAKMSAADLPCMTVIVSAHNEAAVIEEKIRSTLACDYPADRLAVVVVSDASTDATNAIVERLAAVSPNVRLLAIEEHRGKTAGLNLAMEHIDSDLVVFTDANALFDPTALRLLAECFADAEVGYAVGAALYTRNIESGAGGNEGLYWRYELAIKELESAFGSVVGGDGAIYAIRRALYEPLAAEDINDFVNPLQIIAQGYRGVFCAQARAYEDAANDYDKDCVSFVGRIGAVCRPLALATLSAVPVHVGVAQDCPLVHRALACSCVRYELRAHGQRAGRDLRSGFVRVSRAVRPCVRGLAQDP